MCKYLVLFLFIGCASKVDRKFVDLGTSDIEKSFDIEDQKLKKFKIEEVNRKDTNKELQPKNKQNRKIKKTNKRKNNSKNSKNSKKFLKKNRKTSKEINIFEKNVTKNFSYPSNYPKEFIQYDKVSKSSWEKFSPRIYENEEHTFSVSYLGITAGHILMKTMPMVQLGGKKAYHLKAHLRSARFYSSIYELDDSLESFIEVKNFTPLKYALIQRESGQNVDDLQLFDSDELKTYFWYKRIKKGKIKKEEKVKLIPRYFQDSYSALYFVRGFPLKKGDIYEFPIVTRAKIWLLKMEVEKRETISVNGKDILAIKLKAETRFPGVLKKKGDIIFWYSADKTRRLLKFQAKVKIGSITGELIKFKKGN